MKYINLKTFPIGFLLLGMLFISSCADDGISENNNQLLILPQSQELVNATISGRILDEAGNNIEGAKVTLLSGLSPLEVVTDEYGLFLMNEVDSKGGAAFLSVSFPGKFEGFRKMSLVPNQYNYTEVKMLDKNVIGVIDASTGGSLSLSDGASISLPSEGIITEQKIPFNGSVEVSMTWIDPSADDLAQRMIGDLSGINEDGNFQSLGSFGMLTVELSDGNGNELNIAPGEEAQLTFPIPASMRNDAEASIPLWSYNEEIGTWVQEGRAIKEGNNYIGSVGHFSSWNVDIMVDPIAIEGTVSVSSEEGSDLGASYLQVYVCSDVFGRKGGWLCDDGSFRFYNFPKGEKFKLKILDSCGDELYVETYGPFDEDKDLGKISVGLVSNVIRVKGNAVDCNGMPLENATLAVFQNSRHFKFPISEEGKFDFNLDVCGGSDATLEIVNVDDLLSQSVNIPSDELIVEISDLKVCDELENFISVTVDGSEPIVLTSFVDIEIKEQEKDGKLYDRIFIRHIVEEQSDSVGISQDLFLMEFLIDPATLELVQQADIAFTNGEINCHLGDDPDVIPEINLVEYGKEIGDVVKGTFRVENMRCLNWQTGGSDATVVEGSFSVIVR